MYNALIPELRDDPAGMGYAAMSDHEAASAINASTQPARQLVPLWLIKRRLIETGAWLALQAAAAAESAVQPAAKLTLEYVDDHRFENLDLDLLSTQQMLGALQAAGIVSAELAAELDTLADTTTSRAMMLGLGRVEPGHVESARRMMEVQL
jgi:hypothetical protein